jgi:hypothetical protein
MLLEQHTNEHMSKFTVGNQKMNNLLATGAAKRILDALSSIFTRIG